MANGRRTAPENVKKGGGVRFRSVQMCCVSFETRMGFEEEEEWNPMVVTAHRSELSGGRNRSSKAAVACFNSEREREFRFREGRRGSTVAWWWETTEDGGVRAPGRLPVVVRRTSEEEG